MKCRVYLRSTPGFYEQYQGKVDVFVEQVEEAIPEALKELRRTTFRDRGSSMWKAEKVEIIG